MQQFGPHRAVRKLAEGGTAEVWLCRAPDGRAVVVKAMRPELRSVGVDAFAREAEVGRHLHHPNVVRMLGAGEARGLPYLVQEYVDGPSVAQLLARLRAAGAADPWFAARIAADVGLALDHAWSALNVVHCDVSPPNILVTRSGTAKVIDFGISVNADGAPQDGPRRGRFLYLAPEVLLRGELSHRSDLYSLGLVLYALSVGQPAFDGAHEVGARCAGRIVRPSTRRPGFPAALERIVLRLLHVDPAQRYERGAALAHDLHGWLRSAPAVPSAIAAELDAWGAPVVPASSSSVEGQAPARARWVVAGVAAGALGVAVLGGGCLAWVVAPSGGASAGPASTSTSTSTSTAAPGAASVLAQAEAAAAREELGEAARLLGTVAGATLGPDLVQRRDRLRTDLQVRTAVRSVRELLAEDPALALERALALDAAFPGQEQVADLLTDARAAAEARRKRSRSR